MEIVELAQEMRRVHHFNATPRMYSDRLHNWGCRRYMTEKLKDDLCTQLLDDLHHDRDISYVTCDEIRKIIKHCKKQNPRPNSRVFDDLRSIELEICPSKNLRRSRNELRLMPRNIPGSSTTNSLATEQVHEDDGSGAMQAEPSFPTLDEGASDISEFSHLDIEGELDIQAAYDYASGLSSLSEMPTPTGTSITGSENHVLTTNWPTNLPPSLVNSFARITGDDYTVPDIPMQISSTGTALATENLIYLTNTFYTARLAENMIVTDLSSISMAAESKSFWTSVKSAIWMIKNQDETFAFPMLQKVSHLIPQITVAKPLSLLRELLTTLSIVNTRVCPGLRMGLLQIFARPASTLGQVDVQLHRLCILLRQDWVTDEVLTVLLSGILRLAETQLGPHNNEVVELHRARIQLLRRRGDIVAADHIAVDAKRSVESFYGDDSVQTRLIMSEQIYILNSQQRLRESLIIAKDVINRAKRHDGTEFPNARSIYHIEDLAEVYENLGRPRQAAFWLRIALKKALHNWDDKAHTLSLNTKLEKLYADMEMDEAELSD